MSAFFALLKKESISYLRSSKSFIFLFLLFFLYSLLFYTMWPKPEDTLNKLFFTSQVDRFFQSTLFLLLILTQFMIPALCAATFTQEHEEGTYELLFQGTLLRPWQLVIAKYGVALFYIAVLCSTILPVFASCILSGGIQGHQIFYAFLVLGITCHFTIIVSLWCSVTSSQSSQAIQRAYFWILFCFLGLWFFGVVLLEFASILSKFLGFEVPSTTLVIDTRRRHWGYLTSPLALCYEIFNGRSGSSLFPHPLTSPWAFDLPLNVLHFYTFISLLLFLHLIYRLNRLDEKEILSLKMALKVPKKHVLKRFYSLWSLGFLRFFPNTITQKEILYSSLNKSPVKRILFVFFVLSVLVLYNLTAVYEPFEACSSFFLQIVIFGLILPGVSSTILVREMKNEYFDLIRSTLLTPSAFIKGKIGFLFYQYGWILLLALLANFILFFSDFPNSRIDPQDFKGRFAYILFGNLEVFFVFTITILLSLFIGAMVRNLGTAVVLAYLLTFAFYFGIAIACIFLSQEITGKSYDNFFASFSPFGTLAVLYEDTSYYFSLGLLILLHQFYLFLFFCLGLWSFSWVRFKWVER
jgi:ABC-type transport system involved in multi-copper enzyme maturation permease subunit